MQLANLFACIGLSQRDARCNATLSPLDSTRHALTLVRHARLNDIQGGLVLAEVIRHVPVRVDSEQVGPTAERGPG